MSMWLLIPCFVIGGAVGGFTAGLLGIGGGLIVVPFLACMLPYAGFPEESIMHVAVATSLLLIVFTALSSMLAHLRKGNVMWTTFWYFLPGLMAGAIVGANIADLLPSKVMRIIFGLFTFMIAYMMFKNPKGKAKEKPPLKSNYGLTGLGVIIAALCNILGMGGGGLIVPYLNRYDVPMRKAIGTSAVCGVPTALVGVIALAIVGLDEKVHGIHGMTGYLYWIAFLSMIIPSMVFAPLGAALTQRLPCHKLRHLFALFLVIVGVDMLSKSAIAEIGKLIDFI